MAVFTPTITKVSEDARGEIYVITLPGDKELLLLHSNKGSLRGGHAHDVDEIVVMLTGQMLYHKLVDGCEQKSFLVKGTTSLNHAGEVHMGEFLEDSWVLEWKFARKGEWKNIDWAPYRELVNANAAS